MEEVENYMMMPRSWEREPEYSFFCSKCDNGIQWGEKFYRLPWQSKTREILCEHCTDEMISYAKTDVICSECGDTIHEDKDVFITEDGAFICLDCLEEDADADWSVC